jgi:hypothetical protein
LTEAGYDMSVFITENIPGEEIPSEAGGTAGEQMPAEEASPAEGISPADGETQEAAATGREGIGEPNNTEQSSETCQKTESEAGGSDADVPSEESGTSRDAKTGESPPEAGAPGQDELAELRAEVGRLREQLAAHQEALLRMSREAAEFAGLFPDEKLSSLPDEVWEEVRRGIPLAAAYAYHKVRRERKAAMAAEINSKNSQNSAGPVDGQSRTDYYSPAEVRRMSAAEVRENYAKIVDSMKHWS